MGNFVGWYRAYVAGREQIRKNMAHWTGKPVSVADVDLAESYLGLTPLQLGIVDHLLSQSSEMAGGSKDESLGKNCSTSPLAGPSEAAHTTVCANTANDTQVGGSHYRASIQHWDYVEANGIPYLEAQVIRYISRHGKKAGYEDVQKAAHFLQKIAEVRYGRKLS